jgi:hypothetical protein
MGTRSLTFVYEGNQSDNPEVIINMYRQYDGYVAGHGRDVADFLDGRVIVNGFGSNTPEKASNGMGCMAASLVDYFKDGIGNIYLYPASAKDCGQDYEYHIYQDKIIVKDDPANILFDGSWAEFVIFANLPEKW